MQLLKTINPENIDEKDVLDWQYRYAARAVVFDDSGKIGLLHVTKENYFKLPGGGVEENEDIKTALNRECQEELGVKIEVLKEIGSIVEYRTEYKLVQTSYCFLAKVNSIKGEANFTDDEKSSGFVIVWVEPNEALRLLHLRQTNDYQGKFIEERDFCFLEKALTAKKSLEG